MNKKWNIKIIHGDSPLRSILEYAYAKSFLLTDAQIRAMMLIPSKYLKHEEHTTR